MLIERMTAASVLEEVLGRLLVPDNAVIQQATKDLQSVFKDPVIVTALCEVLLGSQNPQVRQYAAVLLRKKVTQIWKKLPLEVKLTIKSTLLQTLSQETIRLVLHSIAHIVAVIVKRDFCANIQWNDLNTFILTHWSSHQPAHKQVAMLLLSMLMDAAAYHYHGDGQFPNLFQIFSSALEDLSDQTITYYTLKSLTAMVAYVGSDDMVVFRDLIPHIMSAVSSLMLTDEDRACEGMELFDELVEADVAIVVPHLPTLIAFCLDVAANCNLGNNIRVKAISFISWLASLKKKALLKAGLLLPILRGMLGVMAMPSDDDDDEEGRESASPTTIAAQVLDTLSNHLPPDKLFTPLMQLLSPWVTSSEEHQRGASLIAIAVITEGCSDHIRQHHMKSLLEVVYKGVRDESQVVRNASLFAIGQFAEYLQPEISEYSAGLMPVLFQFLDTAIASDTHFKSSSITKIFYALESFIEQLGTGLDPYLPMLMDKLFLALSLTKDIHVQELVISTFGAAANACEDKLQPYFTRIVETLQSFIALPHNIDNAVLQAQSIDTLGTLARTIGEEVFRPLAQDCLALGMNLMQSDDPDTRRSVYGMFASLSCVLGDELGPHLPSIVERMMTSLTSNEGVKVHYDSFDVSLLGFDEEDGEEPDMEAEKDDDEGIEGYSVENSYLEEKEDTCNALGEIAENVGSQFLPYIGDCFKEISILSENSVEGIRKAAIWAQGRLCKVWYKCVVAMGTDGREDLEYLLNSTFLSFAATVRTDCDRSVVIATLEMLEDLLKSLKVFSPFPLTEKPLSSLLVSLHDIFNNKAQCQEEDSGDLDDLSEYDSVLVECGGCVLGPLAGAVGGGAFLPHLPSVLPQLVTKLSGSDGDKSFAIGTLAEIIDGLGPHACHVTSLYPTLVEYSGVGCAEEVCSNSVYGLGLLAANGGPDMTSKYPDVLSHLFSVAHARKTAKSRRILDNVCGAVCRMILSHQDSVPLDQVLPVLMDSLPLVEDMEEASTVYSCLQHLLSNRNTAVMSHLPTVLKVLAHDLATPSQLPKGLRGDLVSLVCALNRECPAEMSAASAALSQEQLSILTNIINS